MKQYICTSQGGQLDDKNAIWIQMILQWATFNIFKFQLGSEAWENKTKDFFCFVYPNLAPKLEF